MYLGYIAHQLWARQTEDVTHTPDPSYSGLAFHTWENALVMVLY
jgi:hypothetical protein